LHRTSQMRKLSFSAGTRRCFTIHFVDPAAPMP
jgi:hypothetical protein